MMVYLLNCSDVTFSAIVPEGTGPIYLLGLSDFALECLTAVLGSPKQHAISGSAGNCRYHRRNTRALPNLAWQFGAETRVTAGA
jgi:hypothetical protein